jgi:alpha-L-arabinofuranosidase
VLTHADMRARNTFERPGEIALATLTVAVERDSVLVEIPRHSVVALEILLV